MRNQPFIRIVTQPPGGRQGDCGTPDVVVAFPFFSMLISADVPSACRWSGVCSGDVGIQARQAECGEVRPPTDAWSTRELVVVADRGASAVTDTGAGVGKGNKCGRYRNAVAFPTVRPEAE